MSTYRTIDVNGSEIFYREAGDPASPTLLLLHGFPTTSAQYEQLMGRMAGDLHLIAPDYPGFGRSPMLDGTTTFDRLADVTDAFTDAVGLERFSLYMFDFGSPVGFRIAVRRPERVERLILQNGNAYEAGLGPNMQAIRPYWDDRAAHEDEVRGVLTVEAIRSQYVDGVPEPAIVNPDHWELDRRYIAMEGRDRVMLDLLYDYQSNLAAYPQWHEYMRTHRPPALLPWGRNDLFFPPAGADAYLADLPDADIHLLDTGHFATATHSDEIAEMIVAFMAKQKETV
jgi:pimeloyl-ACP methyl ester carboxylesterase